MWSKASLADEELVRRFSESGEPALFDEMFRRYHKHVFLTCYGIVRNQALAEELSQDTFGKALAHLAAAKPTQLGGWLGTIARNLCLDHLRTASHRMETLPLEDLYEPVVGNESEDAAIAACDVPAVLRRLRPEHRICLNLLYVHRYSYEEIALRLGVDVKQVKSHVQNAKERFRALYEGKIPTSVEGGGQ
jgi:RNA polymerase sigma-70 factor (ECF subfamily)